MRALIGISAAAPTTGNGFPTGQERMDHPSADARDISRLLFEQLAGLEEGTAAFQYARNTLVEAHMHLVRHAARRYRALRNGQFEDVLQVGTIGLIKAIERFELAREVEFPAFALPYIGGEIKRFFRDTTWSVQVPRRLKELRSAVEAGHEDLAARLDRSPTRAELARHLGLPREEVAEAEIAANGYNAGSLDAPPAQRLRFRGAHAGLVRHPERRGRPTGARGGSARPGTLAGRARRPPAHGAGTPLRPRADPGADRRPARHLADARLPHSQEHPRGTAGRNALLSRPGAPAGSEGGWCCADTAPPSMLLHTGRPDQVRHPVSSHSRTGPMRIARVAKGCNHCVDCTATGPGERQDGRGSVRGERGP